uniref:Uncharacterized protein n=1 Tax=Tanacetum cinerariifolium TaxID=118510 RepID=A0A6L2NI60_TANCI|nr:hypothetical protein [Tanacetum cinerariifolium]
MEQENQQQIVMDEALVPITDQVKISASNMRINLLKKQKESTYQPTLDIFKQYTFYNAFLKAADVPQIYMPINTLKLGLSCFVGKCKGKGPKGTKKAITLVPKEKKRNNAPRNKISITDDDNVLQYPDEALKPTGVVIGKEMPKESGKKLWINLRRTKVPDKPKDNSGSSRSSLSRTNDETKDIFNEEEKANEKWKDTENEESEKAEEEHTVTIHIFRLIVSYVDVASLVSRVSITKDESVNLIVLLIFWVAKNKKRTDNVQTINTPYEWGALFRTISLTLLMLPPRSANKPVTTRENVPTISTKQQKGNDKGILFHGVSNANNEQVSSVVDAAGPKQGAHNANESMADSYIVGASDASGTIPWINNNKVMQINELRNEEHVEGAAMTLSLSAIEEVSSRFANTLYGVLESGPWVIQMVPLILNVWSPGSDLHKAEIKKVPVWVKLHHVPIVAYSEVGLSLITTQIGKPIELDTYTGNMCLNSWGRSAYARALIEISADEVLKEDLVIAIPVEKDKGHSLVNIKIEYEWRPPRCSTFLIFNHVNDKCHKLPKVVSSAVVNDVIVDAAKHSNGTDDDGFEVVKKKRNRKKKLQKHVYGVALSKPSLNLHYRRVDKENSTKGFASTSKVGKSTSTGVHDKNVRLENSFSALNDDEKSDLNDTTTWQHTQQVLNVLNESDSDVDEEITLDDRRGNLKTT